MTHVEFRELLARAKLKQVDVARITGYTQRHINNMAAGNVEIPLAVQRIIKLLASVEDLKDDKDN